MNIVKSISLPEELWEEIDQARGREPRSAFIARRLEETQPAGFTIDKSVLKESLPSKQELKRFDAEDERRRLEAQRNEVARQFATDQPSKSKKDVDIPKIAKKHWAS